MKGTPWNESQHGNETCMGIKLQMKYLSYRLTQDIEELSDVVKDQKKQIQKYVMYQKFMEHVLEVSPEVSQ